MSLVIDYADTDGNDSPTHADCAAAYDHGVRTVIIRGSVTYWDQAHQAYHLRPDHYAMRDAQKWRDAGMVVGFYLFPAFGLHAPGVEAQVANFRTSIDWERDTDLPPIFDLEFPGNGFADTGRTQADCLAVYKAFLDEMERVFGVAPITYTSHVEWCDDNGLGDPQAPWAARSPLWIKVPYRLRAKQPPDQVAYAAPKLPGPWQKSGWWMRQGQGDALGFPGLRHHVAATQETPAHDVPTTVDVGDFNVYDANRPQGVLIADLRTPWVVGRLDMLVDAPVKFPDLADHVREFQGSRGLDADGVIGPKTFAALASV